MGAADVSVEGGLKNWLVSCVYMCAYLVKWMNFHFLKSLGKGFKLLWFDKPEFWLILRKCSWKFSWL